MLPPPPAPNLSVFTFPPALASRAWLADSGGHVPEPLEKGWGYVAGSLRPTVLTLAPFLPETQEKSPWGGAVPEKGQLAPSPPQSPPSGASAELEALSFSPASVNCLLSSTLCPRSQAQVHTHAGRGRSDVFPSQRLKLRCCSQHPLRTRVPTTLLPMGQAAVRSRRKASLISSLLKGGSLKAVPSW